jgi:1,6-anhydro-N-acetylmuramate kinase
MIGKSRLACQALVNNRQRAHQSLRNIVIVGGGLPNKVLAAEYRMTLPRERLLAAEIARTRRKLDTRPGREPSSPTPVLDGAFRGMRKG